MKIRFTYKTIKGTARILFSILFVIACFTSYSQNVVINEQGVSTSPGKAVLDLSASNLGFLLPNMTDAKMKAISSPATSLIVFDSTLQCYYIYSGSTWQAMWCFCNAPPTPSPTIAGTFTVCSASSQTYTVSNSGTINATSYTWAVQGTLGTLASGQGTSSITITGITATPGTYTITVKANNSCGASSITTQNITVGGTAAGAAPTNSGPVCTGASVTLSANPTGTAPFTYSWTGPGGATFSSTTAQNPTVNPVVAGVYSVVVTNACGNSGTKTTTVSTVASPGTPTASATGNPYCVGSTITLSALPNGATTYSWTGPNGFTSSSQNPNIAGSVIADAGTYSVVVTNASGCSSPAGVVTVTVNPVPATPSGIGTNYADPCGGTKVAVGQVITYTITTAPVGVTYTWTTTGGTVTAPGTGSSTQNITWTSAGTQTITVTASYTTGCTSSATYTQVVLATATCTYNTCGHASSYTVPTGITTVTLTVSGAEGGEAWWEGHIPVAQTSPNTYGATTTCNYTTVGGTVLNVYVGCVGNNGSGSAGGAGGVGGNSDESGGAGAFPPSNSYAGVSAALNQTAAGGGGGASDIRVGGTALANRIVVGGGGGGDFWAWSECCSSCGGGVVSTFADDYFPTLTIGGTGCGGNSTGANGGYNYCSGLANEYGHGGTTAAAGAGAPASGINIASNGSCPNASSGTCPGSAASAGSSGNGGNGGYQGAYLAYYGVCEYSAGSGGGGGYFGGGGGAGGGGGGGASYAGAGTSSVTYTQCSNSGNGSVTITW